jgi:hypothetical protein
MAERREEKQQRISQELAHAQPQDYAARQLAEYQRISIGSAENRSGGSLGVPFGCRSSQCCWQPWRPFMPLKPITTSDGASHNPPELARLVVCEFMSGC